MKTHTFYRKADVSKGEAINVLMQRFPEADVLKFIEKKASAAEARAAKVKPGSKIYEAKIRVAEFPPSDDDSGKGSEEPKKESAPAPESDDSESNDDSGSDAPVEFDSPGEGGDDLGGEPKEMSHDEKVEHLLEQILDAVKGGGLGGPEDDLGGPEDDLGLPDIGAPGQGDALPPPAGGPGAGPGGPGAPLPPPVKPKGLGAPAAFAKFNPDSKTVTLVREDVTGKVTTSTVKLEAEDLFPTHKVAKIKRRGEAVINGRQVSLTDANLAVVTLVKK